MTEGKGEFPKEFRPERFQATYVRTLVKRDIANVRLEVDRLNELLHGPDAVAMRVCECCIHVSMPDPGQKRE
jgi:hypothetical protein